MPTDVAGKPINLDQLEDELEAAGVAVNGLGLSDGAQLYTYDAQGGPIDLPSAAAPVVSAHVAMRSVTDAEYAAEFQNPSTTPERQVDINHIMTGLLPREQVAMT